MLTLIIRLTLQVTLDLLQAVALYSSCSVHCGRGEPWRPLRARRTWLSWLSGLSWGTWRTMLCDRWYPWAEIGAWKEEKYEDDNECQQQNQPGEMKFPVKLWIRHTSRQCSIINGSCSETSSSSTSRTRWTRRPRWTPSNPPVWIWDNQISTDPLSRLLVSIDVSSAHHSWCWRRIWRSPLCCKWLKFLLLILVAQVVLEVLVVPSNISWHRLLNVSYKEEICVRVKWKEKMMKRVKSCKIWFQSRSLKF